MIVAERKPVSELVGMLEGSENVLVLGCGTCVTVCEAGGEKEVELAASLLRIAARRDARELTVDTDCVERQCDWEFIEEIAGRIASCDAVLSMACGAGVQTMAERFASTPIYPALNTSFIGMPESQGIWTERCMACGNCVLDRTGGVCPVARCAKNLLNGPCGGSQDGKCEIDAELDCAWQLIYDRLEERDELELMVEIEPPKDWSTARDGGPRKVVREDMLL